MAEPLLRGQVYLADLEGEPKYWLVVSPNPRNRAFGSALVVRLTTTNKYVELDSVVAIPAQESFQGWVRCDSLTIMYEDEPIKVVGALSVAGMRELEPGLKAALGLRS